MNDPISEKDLHAWADGRLPAARRKHVEGWLAGQPEARRQAKEWREQNAALHRAYDPVLSEPVPARLLDAVGAAPSRLRLPQLRIAAAIACRIRPARSLAGRAGY